MIGYEESKIEPELVERQTPFSMRREATRELFARGGEESGNQKKESLK